MPPGVHKDSQELNPFELVSSEATLQMKITKF